MEPEIITLKTYEDVEYVFGAKQKMRMRIRRPKLLHAGLVRLASAQALEAHLRHPERKDAMEVLTQALQEDRAELKAILDKAPLPDRTVTKLERAQAQIAVSKADIDENKAFDHEVVRGLFEDLVEPLTVLEADGQRIDTGGKLFDLGDPRLIGTVLNAMTGLTNLSEQEGKDSASPSGPALVPVTDAGGSPATNTDGEAGTTSSTVPEIPQSDSSSSEPEKT